LQEVLSYFAISIIAYHTSIENHGNLRVIAVTFAQRLIYCRPRNLPHSARTEMRRRQSGRCWTQEILIMV